MLSAPIAVEATPASASAAIRDKQNARTVCSTAQAESLGDANRRVGQKLREDALTVAKDSERYVGESQDDIPDDWVGLRWIERDVKQGELPTLIFRRNLSRQVGDVEREGERQLEFGDGVVGRERRVVGGLGRELERELVE